MEDHNTLVFICDVQSNKRQIKRAVEQRYEIKVCFSILFRDCWSHIYLSLFHLPHFTNIYLYLIIFISNTKVQKVNTLIRPDGEKKAYVKLTFLFEWILIWFLIFSLCCCYFDDFNSFLNLSIVQIMMLLMLLIKSESFKRREKWEREIMIFSQFPIHNI